MRRALLMSIITVFLIDASLSEPRARAEAPKAPAEAGRAAELAEEGWRIMNASSPYLRMPRYPLAHSESEPLSWPIGLSTDREQVFYEPGCDRPEAALELFSRAAALDPGLAEAWRGWGRAIEALDLCPMNNNDLTWARRRGLEPRGIGPKKPVAFLQPPSAEALTAAGQKYARAAEAAPDSLAVSLDWGLNLLAQDLEHPEKVEEKLAEVNARWAKHPEWTRPQAPDPLARFFTQWTNQWGADKPFEALSIQRQLLLLAAGREQAQARWAPLLDQALATLDRQIELLPVRPASPEPRPLKDEGREVLVGEETILSPQTLLPEKEVYGPDPFHFFDERPEVISEAARHFQRAGVAEPDPTLAGAMIRIAIELKERQIKLLEPPPEQKSERPSFLNPSPWQDLGQFWLELSRTLTDDQQWREALVKAEKAFEKYRAYEARRHSAGPTYRHWLEAVRRENRPERRVELAEKMLAELQSIDPPADSYVLADTIGLDPTGAGYLEPVRQLAAKSALRFRVAAFLPDGPYRLSLIGEAEEGFRRALEMAVDNQAGLWLHWAAAILDVAAAESDPARFKILLEQSGDKYQQALKAVPQPEALRWPWAFHLAQTAMGRELDLQIMLLEEALRQCRRPLADPEQERPAFLAELHCRLGWLYQSKSGNGWPEFQKGLNYYVRAVENDERSRWPDQAPSRNAFDLGLALLALIDQDPERGRLETTRALRIFRRFFKALPAESEFDASNRYFAPPNRFWFPAASSNFNSPPPLEFSSRLSLIIADHMLEISQVVNAGNSGDKGSQAWLSTELAGLYRHLAWSGLLSSEYERLYLQRAEKQLRRALADLKSEPQMGQWAAEKRSSQSLSSGNRLLSTPTLASTGASADSNQAGRGPAPRPEINLGGQALVASELALVLAEWTLVENEGSAQRLQEAEELWRWAAESGLGSDRYARARWAVRKGDRAAAEELLRHSWSEAARGLFPALEEARDDPALAAWKDEAWLLHIWYGFKIPGQ